MVAHKDKKQQSIYYTLSVKFHLQNNFASSILKIPLPFLIQ